MFDDASTDESACQVGDEAFSHLHYVRVRIPGASTGADSESSLLPGADLFFTEFPVGRSRWCGEGTRALRMLSHICRLAHECGFRAAGRSRKRSRC